MVMTIKKAEEKDLPRILELYAQARAFMAQSGNPIQWGDNRPGKETLEEDIQAGQLYTVNRDGGICGVFAFIPGKDPTYDVIYEGSWHFEGPYAAIHRVAADGSGGIFAAVMEYAASCYEHLRIDTHRDNLPMQRSVSKAGFSYCGIIITHDGTPRLAYDWHRL